MSLPRSRSSGQEPGLLIESSCLDSANENLRKTSGFPELYFFQVKSGNAIVAPTNPPARIYVTYYLDLRMEYVTYNLC